MRKNELFRVFLNREPMKKIHPHRCLKTSVSLPESAYRRVRAAQAIFARNGIVYSKQEVYRRLFKLYLQNWRGRGLKPNGLRRYNADGKAYAIHPLYINQVLHAALGQRATHSGESLSRILDVAIRVYLPRLLESLLRDKSPWSVSSMNHQYWAGRYRRRARHQPDCFINYECKTLNNSPESLEFKQKTQIILKSDLSLMEIWELLHTAA